MNAKRPLFRGRNVVHENGRRSETSFPSDRPAKHARSKRRLIFRSWHNRAAIESNERQTTMHINIFNKRANPKVDEYVRDRIDLVVGRFAERIDHLEVQVIDENGPKGGEDKVCTIDIKLIPRGRLHVRARHENLYSAIVKAIHRAESVIAKAVDRGHRGHEVRHQGGGIRNLPFEEEGPRAEGPFVS